MATRDIHERDQLKLECELLRAQAVIKDREIAQYEMAMSQMSREVCELHGQLEDILNVIRNLKGSALL